MAPATLEGQTLGKYRVLAPLGRGGMAQVYRAYHPQLDRYLAIKVLRSDLVEEEEFLARFQREARAVAGLRHSNIVQVYDFDTQDGLYYMAMELLEGDTLKSRLNSYRTRNERMPLAEIVRILTDVLNGLGYAHSEGIIHRDIKPANIMLTRRGQAVLTDFGIAQIVGGTQYTISGALMGTLNYMAPEQGLQGHCDGRSDIYSLGIVFYEMLTGKPPFDADTPLAILMKHLNDPLPLPSQLNPDIPEPFERVALKALSKHAEDRYQSAAEMSRALQNAAGEAGITLAEGTQAATETVMLPPVESAAEVAVISGTARQHIADAEFAKDETDSTLGQRLAAEKAAASIKEAGTATMILLTQMAEQIHIPENLSQQVQPWLDRALPINKAVLIGLGALIGANLAAIWVSMATNQWTAFGVGWPMELLLVAFFLSLLMVSIENIWLLVPVGVVGGTGVLMAFYSATGLWGLWTLCWPLQPLIVAASIIGPIQLAKRGDGSKLFAHRIGWISAAVCGVTALLLAAVVNVINVFQLIF